MIKNLGRLTSEEPFYHETYLCAPRPICHLESLGVGVFGLHFYPSVENDHPEAPSISLVLVCAGSMKITWSSDVLYFPNKNAYEKMCGRLEDLPDWVLDSGTKEDVTNSISGFLSCCTHTV